MKKVLIIADPLFKKEDLLTPSYTERFKRFEKYGVSFDVATDTTGQRFGSKPTEFMLKMETEGPEWVEPDAEVLEKIKDAEVVLTHFSGVNSKMMDAGKNLKLIGVMRSGVENVSLAEATKRGICVSNCPGRVSEPVADFTVALILVEARNIVRECLSSNNGAWSSIDPKDSANAALRNHTVGLVGLGIIGRKVAARLTPFGVKILAYDPFVTPDAARAAGVELAPLEDLLQRSDFVSVHARLSEETKNLMGEREFNLMKPTAVFINTARAGLVDEDALVKALQEKKIRSAALDVFSKEPLPPDHPLQKLKNVTLTPHRAGATSDVMSNSIDIMLEQLDKYFAGEKLATILN